MANFSNFSELVSMASNGDVLRSPTPTLAADSDIFKTGTTLSPGHAAILEMHANSQSNALTYIAVVLGLYIFGMTIVVIKYIRTERYEARLTRLFHDLVQRDRFFRLSRRRSSLPKCAPAPGTNNIEDDLPLSPILQVPVIQIPEIQLPVESESNL